MAKDISKATQLADVVEAHLIAIDGLASAIREDRAFVGSDPGPRLNEYQQDAIHHAISTLAQVGLNCFHDLMNLLEESV